MMDLIKNQIGKIEDCISDFKSSEYFTLDYTDTKKFGFTMACAVAGLFLVTLSTIKVISFIKKELADDNEIK